MPHYFVETWDPELQKFTPQEGIPKGPYTLMGLRAAIRKLRHFGYPCHYSSKHGSNDPCVSIYAEEEERE